MEAERIKELEKQVEQLKQSRNDYKKKWEKAKRRYDKDKAFFSTMARHNDRLHNEINAIRPVLEKFRTQVKELCPHKDHWVTRGVTMWGDEVRHECRNCHSFIVEEEINREI
jgi:chromosome segregation ATPase